MCVCAHPLWLIPLPRGGRILVCAGWLGSALAHPGLPRKWPGELQELQCDWWEVLRRAIRSKIIKKEKATLLTGLVFTSYTKIRCQLIFLPKSALSRDTRAELFFSSHTWNRTTKKGTPSLVFLARSSSGSTCCPCRRFLCVYCYTAVVGKHRCEMKLMAVNTESNTSAPLCWWDSLAASV